MNSSDQASKVVLHMKLDRAIIRAVDIYAAERDLYRNEAAAALIEKGLQCEKARKP